MSFITLLTDWGESSYYVGVVKSVIKQINPSADIIDITHGITPFQVREAMHILFRAFPDFPRGTIFLVVVDAGVGTSRKPLALELDNTSFLVGPDNGLFTLLCEQYGTKHCVEIQNHQYTYKPIPSSTFHGRDIFAPASAYLSRGLSLHKLGNTIEHLQTLPITPPKIHENTITGEIAFYDHFGNLETNLPQSLLDTLNLAIDTPLTLTISGKQYSGLYTKTYEDVSPPLFTVHPDSSGCLEIALYQGNAQEKTGAHSGDKVEIQVTT
ncbi:MAG: SAM-dependent chlorinase/fluorinase [Candidatus Atribacteria bacterium]|nr:SAM-dependent chlorinase/fluorinase [Candidatus Atribacteria bacterium]